MSMKKNFLAIKNEFFVYNEFFSDEKKFLAMKKKFLAILNFLRKKLFLHDLLCVFCYELGFELLSQSV